MISIKKSSLILLSSLIVLGCSDSSSSDEKGTQTSSFSSTQQASSDSSLVSSSSSSSAINPSALCGVKSNGKDYTDDSRFSALMYANPNDNVVPTITDQQVLYTGSGDCESDIVDITRVTLVEFDYTDLNGHEYKDNLSLGVHWQGPLVNKIVDGMRKTYAISLYIDADKNSNTGETVYGTDGVIGAEYVVRLARRSVVENYIDRYTYSGFPDYYFNLRSFLEANNGSLPDGYYFHIGSKPFPEVFYSSGAHAVMKIETFEYDFDIYNTKGPVNYMGTGDSTPVLNINPFKSN